MEIITSNFKDITLSTKLVRLESHSGELILDISQAFKSGNIYTEVTKVSQYYGKRFYHWIANKNTKEYIRFVEKQVFGDENKPHGKRAGNKKETSRNSVGFKNQQKTETFTSPLIKRKAGRFGGTYLHEDILLEYLMWLDMELKFEVQQFMKKVLKQVQIVRIDRADTKTLFHPLTNAIKEIYIPAQSSENAKRWAYSTLMDLVNLKVLGMRARDFREKNDIPKGKNIYTRDYMSEEQLKAIKKFQSHLNTMLEMGITDYNQLKEYISNIPL